jgi:hypothetical protein
MIGIALLSWLRNPRVLYYHANLLLSFLQYVRSKNLPFSILILKQWSLAHTTIQHLERRHLQTILITIVVRELSIRHTLIPTSSVLQSTSSQHVFKNLIYSLGLSTGLRMIRRTKSQLGIQGFKQTLPKLWSKLSSSIRPNLLGHSMHSNYLWHVQFCQLWSRVSRLDKYKVSYLSQSIHNLPNGIIIWLSSRQTHDKIHGNFFPLPLMYLQRLQ